jgi:hypothetical protein
MAFSRPIALNNDRGEECGASKSRANEVEPSDPLEFCGVTGFSRLIPFFIGVLPFIVFLGEEGLESG